MGQGASAAVCGTLETIGVSPDELEVRHQSKGGDTYVAPVQLFKGKLPAKPPVLEDADRIPVDLRPQADLPPWEARAGSRKGWDRTPWRPDSAPENAQRGGGPRKRLRRIRGNDLNGDEGGDPNAEGGQPLDDEFGANGEHVDGEGVDDGGSDVQQLLRDCLHGWRRVTAFSTGRSIPAKNAPTVPRSPWARGSDGAWGAVAKSFAEGVALAAQNGNSSEIGSDDDAPLDADDAFLTGEDGTSGGKARPTLRQFARTRNSTPPYVARAIVILQRSSDLLFWRGPLLCVAAILFLVAVCALLTWLLTSALATMNATLEDSPHTALAAASPLVAAAWAGDAPGVHVALLQQPAAARDGGKAGGHNLVLLLQHSHTASSLMPAVRVSPIGVAAARNKAQALRTLLATPGADASAPGRCLGPVCSWASIYPLADAAGRLRSGAAIVALLAAGAHPAPGLRLGPWGLLARVSPVFLACARGDGDAIHSLLSAAASADGVVRLSSYHDARLLPWGPPGFALASASPMWAALVLAQSGTGIGTSGGVPPLLLQHGASPHAGARIGPWALLAWDSPLAAAARTGAHSPVSALLRAGASPQAGTWLGPFALVAYVSPLGYATAGGHASAVAALLAGGADASSPAACLGLACFFGSASPLFVALASPVGVAQPGARSARAALLDALLRAHVPGSASAGLNRGLRIGPWGLLGHMSPLGAAAARDDVTAVARLLASGASYTHCARVLTVRLRCATSVARPAAAAVLRDWANAQRADEKVMARAAQADERRAQRRWGSQSSAQQPAQAATTPAERRAQVAKAASLAGQANAHRSQAEAAARRTTALVHIDAGVAEEESMSAAAADIVSSVLSSNTRVRDSPLNTGANTMSEEAASLDDTELRDIERWLSEL